MFLFSPVMASKKDLVLDPPPFGMLWDAQQAEVDSLRMKRNFSNVTQSKFGFGVLSCFCWVFVTFCYFFSGLRCVRKVTFQAFLCPLDS